MKHTFSVELSSEDLRRLKKIQDYFPELTCSEVYSLGIEEWYIRSCQIEDEEKGEMRK